MQKSKASGRISASDRAFDIVNYVITGIVLFLVAYPLYYVLIASISNPFDVFAGKTFFLPSGLTLVGYERVFMDDGIVRGYLNSIYYTVLGTAINLALTLLAGYALSQKTLPGRRPLMLVFLFTMYFNGGLIPTYLLVRDLGLYNTVWALLLPGAISTYNVIITRSFFETSIPETLKEAASIDGSSHFRTFLRIVLPLSTPIVAVMIVYYAVGHWNDWFTALIYLSDSKRSPLQLVLRQILIQNQASTNMLTNMDANYAEKQKAVELIKFASIVVASVPMLIVYPFVQRYFEKGVMIGAIKG